MPLAVLERLLVARIVAGRAILHRSPADGTKRHHRFSDSKAIPALDLGFG
jgi:hypothetical protein